MNAGPAAGAPAELWEQAPAGSDVAVRAPGRANLIGEHTDYNDGLVLPVALDLQTTLVGRRQQGRVRLRSLDVDEVAEVDLVTGRGTTTGWGRYVTAVVAELRSAGLALHGVDGVLSTTLPVGAGLSSSAALEVAVALALLDDRLPPVELARLCQRAEQAAAGLQTGLMDQLASVCGVRAAALLIDCRTTTVESVPLPPLAPRAPGGLRGPEGPRNHGVRRAPPAVRAGSCGSRRRVVARRGRAVAHAGPRPDRPGGLAACPARRH